jgi:hypothetical protein
MQIHNADGGMLLSKTIDSPDSLLDFHRIPRQVVAYKCAAKLEIESFGCRIGAGEHIGLPSLNRRLISSRETTRQVPSGSRISPPRPEKQITRKSFSRGQFGANEIHGVRVLREHHDLRVTIHAQLGEYLLQLLDVSGGIPRTVASRTSRRIRIPEEQIGLEIFVGCGALDYLGEAGREVRLGDTAFGDVLSRLA